MKGRSRFAIISGMKIRYLLIFSALSFIPLQSAETKAHDIGYGRPVVLTPAPRFQKDGLSHYTTPTGEPVVFGTEVIVKLSGTATPEQIASKVHAVKTEALSPSLWLLYFDAGSDILKIVEELQKTEGVVFAQPNLHSQRSGR